jgi:hypothetical protein
MLQLDIFLEKGFLPWVLLLLLSLLSESLVILLDSLLELLRELTKSDFPNFFIPPNDFIPILPAIAITAAPMAIFLTSS